ncbi:MAG TPA: rhodanese-like domain-containing protein [Prolixibacteraceae bacterium]|nr:rhodanese-like domain-containing protein [Prolixibacteraceae bacterium]
MKTNHLSSILLIVVALIIFGGSVSANPPIYVGKTGSKGKVLSKYIEPAELKKIVENPVDSIWIVDVRSEKAYANGHIPTAKSFPMASITDRLDEIPKDQYLIMYCNVGGTVKMVSKKLKKAGYKRYINWGGISRWEWEKETDTIPSAEK